MLALLVDVVEASYRPVRDVLVYRAQEGRDRSVVLDVGSSDVLSHLLPHDFFTVIELVEHLFLAAGDEIQVLSLLVALLDEVLLVLVHSL